MARVFNVKVAPQGVGLGLGIVAALQQCPTPPALWAYEYNRLLNPPSEAVVRARLTLEDG